MSLHAYDTCTDDAASKFSNDKFPFHHGFVYGRRAENVWLKRCTMLRCGRDDVCIVLFIVITNRQNKDQKPFQTDARLFRTFSVNRAHSVIKQRKYTRHGKFQWVPGRKSYTLTARTPLVLSLRVSIAQFSAASFVCYSDKYVHGRYKCLKLVVRLRFLPQHL